MINNKMFVLYKIKFNKIFHNKVKIKIIKKQFRLKIIVL